MKWTFVVSFVLCFVIVALAIPPVHKEEKRLLQFSEDHKEWIPLSDVEKLMCDPSVHFMDITDYYENYYDDNNNEKEYKEMDALPLPVAPTRQSIVEKILPLAKVGYVTSTITSLSENYYTRYYKSETGVLAARWLQSEYQRITDASGRKDIVVTNITNPNFPQANVVATIQGAGPNKDNIVVIGGHLDSVGSSATGRSPGADDDASGSATVFEVFRVLVEANYIPDFTIQFFGYAAEEGGLLGSQAIAQDYQKRNVPVYAALQLDMTGYTSTGSPQLGLVTDYTNAELNAFVRLLVSTYTKLPWVNKQCGYACSDHASWNRTGYRSAFPFETSPTNPNIHSQNDLIARLNVEQLLQFVYLGIAYVIELAGVV